MSARVPTRASWARHECGRRLARRALARARHRRAARHRAAGPPPRPPVRARRRRRRRRRAARRRGADAVHGRRGQRRPHGPRSCRSRPPIGCSAPRPTIRADHTAAGVGDVAHDRRRVAGARGRMDAGRDRQRASGWHPTCWWRRCYATATTPSVGRAWRSPVGPRSAWLIDQLPGLAAAGRRAVPADDDRLAARPGDPARAGRAARQPTPTRSSAVCCPASGRAISVPPTAPCSPTCSRGADRRCCPTRPTALAAAGTVLSVPLAELCRLRHSMLSELGSGDT